MPEALNAYWWTLPVLVLQAVKNAVLEEVIVVGYLLDRLRRLGFGPWASTGLSAVLRGSYHLYQGFGPFLGNAVMGVIFAQWYLRKRPRDAADRRAHDPRHGELRRLRPARAILHLP